MQILQLKETINLHEHKRKLKHGTKMKFSVSDFFSKCDRIRSFLQEH